MAKTKKWFTPMNGKTYYIIAELQLNKNAAITKFWLDYITSMMHCLNSLAKIKLLCDYHGIDATCWPDKNSMKTYWSINTQWEKNVFFFENELDKEGSTQIKMGQSDKNNSK